MHCVARLAELLKVRGLAFEQVSAYVYCNACEVAGRDDKASLPKERRKVC